MSVEPPIRRFFVGLESVSSGFCKVAGDEDGKGVKLSCVCRFLREDLRE